MINITDVLDIYKRQALSSLLDNYPISFYNISNKMRSYIKTGGLFESLLTFITSKNYNLSVNRIDLLCLLSRIDFYTLFIILKSIETNNANLLNVIQNKLYYILNLYTDFDNIINAKTLDGNNKYSLHENFSIPKNILSRNLNILDSEGNGYIQLSTNKFLSLPILSTIDYSPLSLSLKIDDTCKHTFLDNSTSNSINVSVHRSQIKKTGFIKSISSYEKKNVYPEKPIVSGVILGYISENLFIKINTVNAEYITILCSTDSVTWSSDITVYSNTETELISETGLKLGVFISFNLSLNKEVGDLWVISLGYNSSENPECESLLRFNNLSKCSYLYYEDYSPKTCDILNIKNKPTKFSHGETIYDKLNNIGLYRSNNIENIIPIFDSSSDITLRVRQNKLFADTINGKFSNRYDFNIKEIKSVFNEYDYAGEIIFNPINIVEPIYNVSISSDYFIPNKAQIQIEDKGKSYLFNGLFVEFYILAQTRDYQALIPMLESNFNGTISEEYIKFVKFTKGGERGIYTTKFPTASIEGLFNLTNSEKTRPDVDYKIKNNFNSKEVNNFLNLENINLSIAKNVYVASYKPTIKTHYDAVNRTGNINWNTVTNTDISYLYFRDIDNKVKLALGLKDKPFTGKIYGVIKMKSANESYLSPMLFSYNLMVN